MNRPDPRIDAYIAQSAAFAQPLLTHLRSQVHAACPEAEEAIKWGMPHFMLDGRILAGMAAFKTHCAFGFWQQDVATPDPGKRREAMGQFGRIGCLADLPPPATLQASIQAAAAGVLAGKTRERPPAGGRSAITMPEDFRAALAAHEAARTVFTTFPPGKQRDYLEWIVEAKKAETRAQRIRQSLEWLAEGKSRNWKYERG